MDATVGLDAALDATVVPDATQADSCIPLGCAELGYECGMTMDNCGQPLNCNNNDGTSPCMVPNRCGGDPAKGTNKCGCAVRPDACQAQGAQCGLIDECGMQKDCGTCANGAVCLNNMCACTPKSNPCEGKVCGMADNGCGTMVACGPTNGTCAQGVCGATGQCACRPRAEACAGKTGTVTENGCSYNCDNACVPDNATACAGAECGTATNNCGEVVNCGSNAGQCATGNSCVAGTFITDNALPARTASYQGGYCVPTNVSKLLGKYATRVHAFRQGRVGGEGSASFLNRAEAVGYAVFRHTRSTQKTQVEDIGCVATTVSNSALGVRSIVPYYRRMDSVKVDLTLNGDKWSKPDATNPVLGMGIPNGYAPGMPSFCQGKAGQTVDLPADDPRRGMFWSDNKCVCPAQDAVNALPANAYEDMPSMYSRDCRIVDSDKDGKLGFSAIGGALGIRTTLYSISVVHAIWEGVIRDDRYHVGTTGEAVQPLQRSVAGCSGSVGCSPQTFDCGCPERLQPILFIPLADDNALSCDPFYRNMTAANPFDWVDQSKINADFGGGFGMCTGAGQCPAGTICRAGACVQMTAPGVCGSGTQSPCTGSNAGKYCEPCPAGTECRAADGACWPTASVCPASGPVGGLCM